MLSLKSLDGARVEIPASCIQVVMKPSDDSAPSSVLYDLGSGPEISKLSDQYGFVKKLVSDSSGIPNPIELCVVEMISSNEDGSPVYGTGKIFIARSRIQGRIEVLDDPNGVKSRLFIDWCGNVSQFRVTDSLDDMDGIEPAVPVELPAPALIEGS